MNHECWSCRHWHSPYFVYILHADGKHPDCVDGDRPYGHCRVNPPVAKVWHYTEKLPPPGCRDVAVWPTTYEEDSCGKYARQPKGHKCWKGWNDDASESDKEELV